MNIHPVKKLEVAQRLVRWALAKDYGFDIEHRSPMYVSHEIKGQQIHHQIRSNVRPFDVSEILGFTIAGEDQNFVSAQAKINKNTIEVWAESVPTPKSSFVMPGQGTLNVIL